ncbi:hypothetical protein BDZ89DRAFT_1056026 [Hymenopellis radicata]|nr:hypothetical protein BDZ89DRAFT_1056026 [Hymenopellis radicata]
MFQQSFAGHYPPQGMAPAPAPMLYPPMYPHYPPPPPPPVAQPVFLMEPNTFRHEFAARLRELQVNSRPIIQNLSMLAHDYTRYAHIVAQCLESHIREVPPWMKLPAFYLLDMISKNIYEPYARQFASFVIPLFLESYHMVDESTRSKMEELALTWRSGAPNNKELFGTAVQVAIERGMWGEASSATASASRITKAQVLSELEYTLGQRQRAMQTDPRDSTAKQHVAVLTQLREVDQLQQILTQLRSLVPASGPPPPPQVAPSWPAVQPAYTAPAPVPPVVNATPVSEDVKNIPSSSAPGVNYSALLSSLLKAGVVPSNSGTPVGAGLTVYEQADSQTLTADVERAAERSYRDWILSHDVQLSTTGITRTTPAIADVLYAKDSIQCKQCGVRYPDNPVGKQAREEHLDMHFRQNRKANENVGRGHSRSWFVAVEDWIHDTADVKGKGRDGSRRISADELAAAERSKRDAELRQQFVIVRGDSAKDVPCPICKETLKSVFKEDDEDWVWYNAVEKDGRVYHATCHAETATNSLATRMRNEFTSHSRSRSGTPEFARASTPLSTFKRESLSPSPDSKTGIKRKADEANHESSPPVKKMALSRTASR